MTTEIKVPTLGESVTEATIGQWCKKVGDTVAADEPVVELETDKVTLEVNAQAAGVLGEFAAAEGDTVNVGALLGTITEGPDGVTFYTLPDLLVNIQADSGRPTYLKLKLTLEMHDAELAAHLQEEMPRMQDMFQGFLRELRPEDLAGSAGSFQLRAEILRRVNLIAAPGKVDAVLIEEMLVQ